MAKAETTIRLADGDEPVMEFFGGRLFTRFHQPISGTEITSTLAQAEKWFTSGAAQIAAILQKLRETHTDDEYDELVA